MASLRWEKNQPWVGAIVVTAATAYYLRGHSIPGNFPAVLNACLNTSGILAGFIGTTLTILLSIKSTRVYKQMVKNGYGKDIVGYVLWAFYGVIGLALISGIGMFWGDFKTAHPFHAPYFMAWIWFLTFAGLAFFRLVKILAILLQAEE